MLNVTKEYQFLYAPESRILGVEANGGSVAVQVYTDGQWLTSDTYAQDTVVELYFGTALFRIVPTGGAEYSVL